MLEELVERHGVVPLAERLAEQGVRRDLAALLDNTSGSTDALNGTFQTVTNQVGSLGFDEPVFAALANAPLVGEGLYVAPAYEPTSSPTGGIWGDFWNAASAVVTTIAGAVVSIVGDVWNAALAASIYFSQLGNEALAIGGQVLARAATTPVDAGRLIVTALKVLLEYALTLIRGMLAAVTQPIVD